MRATAKITNTRRGQVVQLPADLHLDTPEVSITRDPQTGSVILSPIPTRREKRDTTSAQSWDEIFAALDAAGVPEDIFPDRLNKS
jgi:antitoxin VapB